MCIIDDTMPWKKLELPSADKRRELDEEYRGKARFLVDESIGAAIAKYLSESGYNTKYVGDEGLEGHSDEDVAGERCGLCGNASQGLWSGS